VFCPKCKTDHAHRSHRHGLTERLASLFAFYPYRCAECVHRFLRFRYSSGPKLAGGPTLTEREIKSTRTALRWKGKRREFFLYGVGFLLILAFLYFVTRERSPSDGS
jgi:hypothetical protein